ncbi:hypothetical protein N0824_03678 [Microcystis sp. 0824]|nr:hypothetical protein N0824_03678 [Microcystis sp. 0824]
MLFLGCGVWGVGCGEVGKWGVGRINKNNLLNPQSSILNLNFLVIRAADSQSR